LLQLIWLKRDLRLNDHAPLQAAMATGLPTLLLYVYEPTVMHAPDYDIRHARFIWQSLQELQHQLTGQTSILILKGEMIEVLEALNQHLPIRFIYSHMETGNGLTFNRDKAVDRWCRQKGITWKQWSDRAIQRGLKTRDNWPKQWYGYMEEAEIKTDIQKISWATLPVWHNILHRFEDLFPGAIEKVPQMQPGGSSKGLLYLESFLKHRSVNYQKHISKPALSRTGCSRLSPYLAYGCLSIRQVYQATWAQMNPALNGDATVGKKNRPLTAFLDRLRWHSHFMQKLESQPGIEFYNTNAGYNGCRLEVNDAKILAWMEARTGYPLVDACMLCLKETGYLNFRMRAMLVSFLTHHLWQPWQEGVHHLARLFLDYEPGIHYPQFQMQAGVTGINTIRIYNPVKQGLEHDAEGNFIKKWIPELSPVPLPLAHTPWLTTRMEQQQYKFIPGSAYHKPIVSLEAASKYAREQLWKMKNSDEVKSNNKEILKKLSGRKKENEKGA
jgi:deoxyribodipyrimidine photo-lyase